MALKVAFLIFGIIAVQFPNVFCDLSMNVNDVSGKLEIECSKSWSSNVRPYHCKFQLSDGFLIEYDFKNVGDPKKITTESYNYTQFFPEKNSYKCKIQIEPVFANLTLRNMWKCWIITQDSIDSKIMSYTLQTPKPIAKNGTSTDVEPVITSNAVHVRSGDDFLVGCQAMEPIDFCVLTSPNGTMYTVQEDYVMQFLDIKSFKDLSTSCKSNFPDVNQKVKCDSYLKQINEISKKNALKILSPATENNFPIGDCFTRIEKANNRIHKGDWSCQVHLKDSSKELKKNVAIITEASYILPSYEKDTRKIACGAIPTLPFNVDKCYWRLPNGTGIYQNNFQNVTFSNNDTHCSILLQDWHKSFEGKWSCFVYFKNIFGEKLAASTFIDNVSASSTLLPTLFYVSLLSISTIFITFYM